MRWDGLCSHFGGVSGPFKVWFLIFARVDSEQLFGLGYQKGITVAMGLN